MNKEKALKNQGLEFREDINIKGGGGRLLYYQIISMCRYAQSCAFISVIELPRIPAYCPKVYSSPRK